MAYLATAFVEIGMVEASGFGPACLSWREIHAYSQMTRSIGSRWEALMLRNMSNAYLEGQRIGADEFGLAPWEPSNG